MNKTLKTKDLILIALLTAVYITVYFVTMLLTNLLGALGHAISPGVNGLLAGTIIYFMAKKVGKFGQYTIFTGLLMGVFSLVGGGYLPWILSSLIAAILADFIASRSKQVSTLKIAIASGIMHVGQAFGAIIPSLFFLDSYIETWVNRNQKYEAMLEYVKYTSGMWAVWSTIIVFALAVAGVYLGHSILKKHIKD